MKQHVTLGDAIVRDLPNVDLIRAGVRYHHERWDGGGYPDALAGEDIPLVARVVSVGDVFSAMTTTRPYRKALGVEEALNRLEIAGGTQLEERLVEAFVEGHPDRPRCAAARARVLSARPVDAIPQGGLRPMARPRPSDRERAIRPDGRGGCRGLPRRPVSSSVRWQRPRAGRSTATPSAVP